MNRWIVVGSRISSYRLPQIAGRVVRLIKAGTVPRAGLLRSRYDIYGVTQGDRGGVIEASKTRRTRYFPISWRTVSRGRESVIIDNRLIRCNFFPVLIITRSLCSRNVVFLTSQIIMPMPRLKFHSMLNLCKSR